MQAFKAVIEVTPDGIFIVQAENSLKPGQHQVLIVTDESTIQRTDQKRGKKKKHFSLKPIALDGWPKDSTFRREAIYNDDVR
ncbi:MAG: hypothetical protein AB7S77_13735 [Desulfatirhabdiaceae bacterium]